MAETFEELKFELEKFGINITGASVTLYTLHDDLMKLQLEMGAHATEKLLQVIKAENDKVIVPTELTLASGITVKVGDVLVSTELTGYKDTISKVTEIKDCTHYTVDSYYLKGENFADGYEMNVRMGLSVNYRHATDIEKAMYHKLKKEVEAA